MIFDTSPLETIWIIDSKSQKVVISPEDIKLSTSLLFVLYSTIWIFQWGKFRESSCRHCNGTVNFRNWLKFVKFHIFFRDISQILSSAREKSYFHSNNSRTHHNQSIVNILDFKNYWFFTKFNFCSNLLVGVILRPYITFNTNLWMKKSIFDS